AGVDDVDADARSGLAAHVAAVEGKKALIDAVQSPRGGGSGGNGRILFHELHARIAGEGLCSGIADVEGEAFEPAPIRVPDGTLQVAHRAGHGGSVGAGPQDHDVSTGNVSRAAAEDRKSTRLN